MSSKLGRETSKAAPRSLAVRLTAWYAGSAFLLVLGVSGFLYALLVSNLEREDTQLLAAEAQSVRAFLTKSPKDLTPLRQTLESEATSRQHFHFFVRVLDQNQATLVESPGMTELLPPTLIATQLSGEASAEIETPAGKAFHVAVEKVHFDDEYGECTIQIAMDRTFEEELLGTYRKGLIFMLAIALLACAVVGYQIARRGLRPVREMAATASRIRSSTLNERIDTEGLPAELSILASTFNDMLDRLEESFARLSRFSADIAHELRTPVNNLRGEAEVALGRPRTPEEYREVLGSSLEECGRLSRMIDSLLFLARAEGTEVALSRERLDISRELESVREFYSAAAHEAGIRLVVEATEPVFVPADRQLVQRAVGNLVSNALAHTPAGGEVVLDAENRNGRVHVKVTDTGHGIPAEHLPHVFDRFYRGDAARSTHSGRVGLGLAIVRGIASMHGGSADIQSTVGKGTQVTLTFPQAPSDKVGG